MNLWNISWAMQMRYARIHTTFYLRMMVPGVLPPNFVHAEGIVMEDVDAFFFWS